MTVPLHLFKPSSFIFFDLRTDRHFCKENIDILPAVRNTPSSESSVRIKRNEIRRIRIRKRCRSAVSAPLSRTGIIEHKKSKLQMQNERFDGDCFIPYFFLPLAELGIFGRNGLVLSPPLGPAASLFVTFFAPVMTSAPSGSESA